MNFQFVYPMFAMVALSTVVLILMFVARAKAIIRRELPMSYFRTFQGAEQPSEYVMKTTRHFINLFEVPVLFYTACIVAILLPLSSAALWTAWAYVAARVLQAYLHIGPNRVMKRMRAYGLSWLFLLALWVQIVIAVPR